MLLYLALTGVLLSLLLIYFNAKQYRSSFYLGLFFLLVSFYSFHHYIFIYAKSAFWVSVLYVNTTSVFYLTGPMSYFYVRSILTDDARLQRKDLWHFLPAVIHFACAIPYVIKPWSYKKEIGATIAADYNFMATHKVNYIAQLLGSVKPIYLSRPLLALTYTIASLIIFSRYQRRRKTSVNSVILSARQQTIMNRWLRLFLGFQFLLFISFASLLLIRWPVNPMLQFLNFNDLEFVVGIALIGLLITPFLFPQILYGLPNPKPAIAEASAKTEQATITKAPASFIQTNEPEELTGVEPEEKLAVLQLESNYLETIGEKVDDCMITKQPFLSPAFNLLKLAHLIDIPAHHLGFYFREVKQQTFNDYRNTWRIEYAKKLILEGKADELTLESIGLQAGFASRSSFFKAFKKVTGDTPGNLVNRS